MVPHLPCPNDTQDIWVGHVYVISPQGTLSLVKQKFLQDFSSAKLVELAVAKKFQQKQGIWWGKNLYTLM